MKWKKVRADQAYIERNFPYSLDRGGLKVIDIKQGNWGGELILAVSLDKEPDGYIHTSPYRIIWEQQGELMAKLGLFLLETSDMSNTYVRFIVCAESQADALNVILQDYTYQGTEWQAVKGKWEVTRVGSANKAFQRGVLVRVDG